MCFHHVLREMLYRLWNMEVRNVCAYESTVRTCIYDDVIMTSSHPPPLQAIKRARELHNMAAAPPTIFPEYKLWEEHWSRCCKELGQWDSLNEFGKSQNGANPFLGEC